MPSSTEAVQISYEIDLADRITAVSESWAAFARENHGEHLEAPGVVGSSLWSAIGDPTTREIYRTLVSRVREGRGSARFSFRCDSPAKRRELEMRIVARDGGAVRFTTMLLREQARADIALLDPVAPRTESVVVVCGWCAQVRVAEGHWLEVEAALRELRLFERTALPQLSHGICPPCAEAFTRALDDELGRSPQDVVLGTLPPG